MLRRNDAVKSCGATSSRPSVNMTLISGSLSSYDDPEANPIDPAPTCFQVLAVTHAALGLYMLLRPEAVIQTVYSASAGNSLVTSLMAMLGGMHVYASVFAHALHGAAENSRLDSTTYQRLAFGLGAWSFVSMAVVAFTKCQLATVYANVYAGLFCATIITQFVCAHGQHVEFVAWTPGRSVTQNVYGIGQLFSALAIFAVWLQFANPSGFLGSQLSNLSWITVPAGTLGHEFILFLSGAGFMVYSAFSTLLDASQRNRLGASTFRLLNLATGLLGLLWGVLFWRLVKDGSAIKLCLKEVFSSLASYTGHIADVFAYKTSIIFPAIGVVCLIKYVCCRDPYPRRTPAHPPTLACSPTYACPLASFVAARR